MNILTSFSKFFAILLFIGFGMSLFASYAWYFDIFSHFAIQYAIGAIILGLVFLSSKKWCWSFLLIVVAALNVYEIRISYSDPLIFSPPQIQQKANLTIAHYNKLYKNEDWDIFRSWVESSHQDIDIIIFNETTPNLITEKRKYKEYFPYLYPDKKWNHFNDVSVMSRYPFKAEQVMGIDKNGYLSGTKIILEKPDIPEPIHLYSIHAHVPFGATRWDYQKLALDNVVFALQNDPHPYKIFSGDWNLTPYSPVFQRLLENTGMKYNDYSVFPKVTWNSHFLFPFFKIPIDHFIYSPEIKQISKEVGPALGSDHHMLIGKFYIPLEMPIEK